MNINRDIAEKVMRWHRTHTGLTYVWKEETFDVGVNCEEFNPSNNMVDAWLVVEKLHQQKIYLTLDGHEQGYDAEFASYREYDPDPISGEAREDTAPLAICKAALATIREIDNVE